MNAATKAQRLASRGRLDRKEGQSEPKYTLANDIEQTTQILASQIKAIAEAGATLERSALKRKTIVWLVAKAANVSVGDAESVLDALPQLARTYLR